MTDAKQDEKKSIREQIREEVKEEAIARGLMTKQDEKKFISEFQFKKNQIERIKQEGRIEAYKDAIKEMNKHCKRCIGSCNYCYGYELKNRLISKINQDKIK